uniref:BUD22 domain-containing protein n=1 Tax=Parastrongyloides trichosuri TaxID=131310 RepID=A0A0N4ZG21_PARTI
MTTLNPKQLNEKIVTLRSTLKKAKVHLTRHHIKAIKKLKTNKNPNSLIKIQRLEEELNVIKSVKPDPFSKSALINTKTKDEVLTKLKDKTPLERVEAKLVYLPCYQKEIDKFREKFPKWYEEVPFFLQRFGMISKERKGKIEEKEVIKSLKKNLLKGKEDVKVVKEDVNVEDNEDKVSDSEEEVSDNDEEVSDNNEEDSNEEISDEEEEDDISNGESSDEESIKAISIKQKISKGPIDNNKFKLKVPDVIEDGECVIKRVNLSASGDTIKLSDSKVLSNDNEEDEEIQVSSSFFLEGKKSDNEEEIESNDKSKPKYANKIFENRKGRGLMRKKNNTNNKMSFHDNAKDNKRKFPQQRDESFKRGRFDNKGGNNKFNQNKKQLEPSPEELHPSWAAKKRMKEQAAKGFQGKRIVFEDE